MIQFVEEHSVRTELPYCDCTERSSVSFEHLRKTMTHSSVLFSCSKPSGQLYESETNHTLLYQAPDNHTLPFKIVV